MFDSQQGCARSRLKSYLSSKASSPLRVQAGAHLSPRISSAPHPLLVPTTTLQDRSCTCAASHSAKPCIQQAYKACLQGAYIIGCVCHSQASFTPEEQPGAVACALAKKKHKARCLRKCAQRFSHVLHLLVHRAPKLPRAHQPPGSPRKSCPQPSLATLLSVMKPGASLIAGINSVLENIFVAGLKQDISILTLTPTIRVSKN